MNSHNLSRRLSILLFACLLAFAPETSAQRSSDFMKSFRSAMGKRDKDEMQRLVTEHEGAAVIAIAETCELIGAGSSDALEKDIEFLGSAWRGVYSSGFADELYNYFSLLSSSNRPHREELQTTYGLQITEYENAREEKDASRLSILGHEFKRLAKSYDKIADHYASSNCWILYARCLDEESQGPEADLRSACEGFGMGAEKRHAIELTDATYREAKERFDKLEYDGFGAAGKGPDARASERANADPSFTPRALEVTYQMVEDLEAVQRPLYHADAGYQLWTGLNLGATGSEGPVPALVDSPTVTRDGASKASFHGNGKGNSDVLVPLTGNFEPVTIQVGHGDQIHDWSFLAAIGREEDTYQGIQKFNLAPTDDLLTIYVAPAASIVGEIEGTEIQIFDDNMDGIYGGGTVPWGAIGLVGEARQHEMDSVRVGKSKRALPWSQFVQVGDDWYSFVHGEAYDEIIIAKVEFPTGTIKLDVKGPDADYMILRGVGNGSGIFIDAAAAKRGVEVPVGSYELFNGRVGKGKGEQTMKALVLPGHNTPSWTVTEGKTTTVKLGAPFGFDFDFSQDEAEVSIDGETVAVVGSAGERYERLWNCVPRPLASERAEGARKGGKAVGMRPNDDQQLLGELGWKSVWFPLSAKLSKKKKGATSEVQLVEKKNKLFGKITSDWKKQ